MISRLIIVGWTIYCIWGLTTGASSLDQTMIQTNNAYALGAGIGMMFWFVIWFIVVVPVALIALVFRPRHDKKDDKISVSDVSRDVSSKIFLHDS